MHSTACPDWAERLVQRRSIIPPPIFADEAEAALNVFKSLRIVDAPDQPTFGEACEPWVFEFVSAIFGAYDATTGERLIREFFLLISKKNSKSTIAAGIMVTALIRNWRHSAELLILAPTIEVAKNSFDPARDMVYADPELKDLLKVQEHLRTITNRKTNAELKVVAADSDVVSGKKAAFVLVEELWKFGPRARADAMLREATGGLVSRPEGFVIFLTTESDDPPEGVFKTKLQYFRDVRDGKIDDPRSLAVIFEFPEAMVKAKAYLDPSNFYVTNPNLGRSVSLTWLKDELTKAQRSGKEALQLFLAKHLNVEPGMAARSDNWPGADFWKNGDDPTLTLDSLIQRSEVIVVCLDGGGLDDLFGITVLGRERVEVEVAAQDAGEEGGGIQSGKVRVKRWLSWSHALAHRVVLERRMTIAPKLLELHQAGELTLHDGVLDLATGLPPDIAWVIRLVSRIRELGLLFCVAADPAGLGEVVDALADIDVTVANQAQGFNWLLGAPQGISLMNALKTVERKLANGTFLHAVQLLMEWCVGNVKLEPTATAIRATKQTAGDAKIDPAMALFNGAYAMSTNPPARRSVYEERGVLVL